MSRTTHVIPASTLGKLRQRAKQLRKKSGTPLHEALEVVAKEAGLPNWHAAVESAKITDATEKAYLGGLIVAMDVKDGMDFRTGDAFVPDDRQAPAFCSDDLKEAYVAACIEEGEPATDRDVAEYLDDQAMNLLYFRYAGSDLPKDLRGALKLVGNHSFWPPQYVWLRGAFSDVYGEPAVDEGGEVLGVRF